jgi:hypothetical protein
VTQYFKYACVYIYFFFHWYFTLLIWQLERKEKLKKTASETGIHNSAYHNTKFIELLKSGLSYELMLRFPRIFQILFRNTAAKYQTSLSPSPLHNCVYMVIKTDCSIWHQGNIVHVKLLYIFIGIRFLDLLRNKSTRFIYCLFNTLSVMQSRLHSII